jgi:hypothetical protein
MASQISTHLQAGWGPTGYFLRFSLGVLDLALHLDRGVDAPN